MAGNQSLSTNCILRSNLAPTMNATLYLPQQPPQSVSAEGLSMPNPETGLARVPEQVPALLDCASDMVDIQACGSNYVAYSVFDYEDGQPNESAMDVLARLTGHPFDLDDADSVLLGPVLIVFA